ncbi:hypothetical protein IGI04_035666 [Brassica rapa subsp. trilocularis]|uniref:Uncharacterized protein n=1 Tax=Brassica rapa subsp. trilocularis TaxID=1813537 RepID=A0ABQ7LC95_BRACM|nr:hypothetical protein IGI04_035666 [Brassica rapa subsp. trilocularis]
MCTEQTAHVGQNNPNSPREPVGRKLRAQQNGKRPVLRTPFGREARFRVLQPMWAKTPEQSTGRVSVLSPRTNVLICVLIDSQGRPVCGDGHTGTHTDSHGRPVCADGHTRTSYSPRGPKSPEQSTGRAREPSPTTRVLICVLMESHGRPVCAAGHTQTHTDSHERPVCADGQPWTATDVLYSPRGPKSPKQSTGRASVRSPRTSVLICVLMDSHGRSVCADGHTRTATDVLCVLADTHGRYVCTEQTAHVGQNHSNSPREGPAC